MKDWERETERIDNKKDRLHEYLVMKLEEGDYHAVADAAMDLRELDARLKAIKEWLN